MNTARQSRTLILTLGASLGLIALMLLPVTATALEQRTLSRSFAVQDGQTLRLANLAGEVELVAGSGNELTVEATIFGESRSLVDSLNWVESRDRSGRPEWALSYPVDEYRGFHYPRPGSREKEAGFLERILGSIADGGRTTTTYMERRISVYGSRSGSAPTLYANLRITVPDEGAIVVRNVVGPVNGGELAGDLMVDTGSGSVELEGFRGKLNVDTGSGRVRLGSVRGETVVDTGSGSIEIDSLVGNANLDTGSGSIKVHQVAAGKLRADTGSGSIKIEDGSVGTLVADTGSGSIQVLGVEVEIFEGDTGSGSVTLESSLANAQDVRIDTGSGSVKIYAGPDASFDLEARQGSGSLNVGYDDATLRKRGHKVVGATRGDRQTRIRVETGSGGCVIAPQG